MLLCCAQVRHMFWMTGCIPADRERITAELTVCSLGFLPEGIAGIFYGANRCAANQAHLLVYANT